MGFVLPSFFISESDLLIDRGEARNKVERYITTQNIIVSVFAVLLIALAREHPPSPPSASACKVHKQISVRNELSLLARNRSYLLVVACYTLCYGTVTAIGTILSSLT